MYTDHSAQDVLDDMRLEPIKKEEPPRFRLKPALYAWLELDGPYQGARVHVRLNPPLGLLNLMTDGAGIQAHLHEMVDEWNLDDEDGRPVPLTPEGVGQIDPDLSSAIMKKWTEKRELSKRR